MKKCLIILFILSFSKLAYSTSKSEDLGKDLAECSAVFSIPYKDAIFKDHSYNSELMSEVLFVYAKKMLGNQKAIDIHTKMNSYLLKLKDTQKNKYQILQNKNAKHCRIIIEKNKALFNEIPYRKIDEQSKQHLIGYWVHYFSAFEEMANGEMAAQVEVIYLNTNDEVRTALGRIYKDKNKYTLPLLSGYVLAIGKWSTKNDRIISRLKVVKNTSLLNKNIKIDTPVEIECFAIGNKIVSSTKIYKKLDLNKTNLVDEGKIFSDATEDEKKAINKALEKEDRELDEIRKMLRGDMK